MTCMQVRLNRRITAIHSSNIVYYESKFKRTRDHDVFFNTYFLESETIIAIFFGSIYIHPHFRNIIIMKKFITCIIFLFYLSFAYTQEIESHFVYFDSDQSQLNDDALDLIENLSIRCASLSDYSMEIIGHTDEDGTHSYNDVLAKKRASRVEAHLMGMGVPAERMTVQSYGEQQLLSFEYLDQEISKSKNRRVEIILSFVVLESMEDLLTHLETDPVQFYSLYSEETIDLLLSHGTEIKIPANAFVFENGLPVEGMVELEIKEAFNYNQFLQHDLTCMSDDRLLESGGMLYVGATAGGEKIRLKEGTEMEIRYPLQDVKENMELFYGESTGLEEPVNWAVAEQPVGITMSSAGIDTDWDWSPILEVEIEKKDYPRFSVRRMRAKPTKPKAPYEPRKPVLQKKENIHVPLSRWQKFMYSDQKIMTLRDEKFNQHVDDFNKAMAKYERKYDVYEKAKDEYEINLQSYFSDVKEWKNEVQLKFDEIQKYQEEYRNYNYHMSGYHALRFLNMKKDSLDQEKLEAMFSFLLYSTPESNSIPFYQKVFGKKFRSIFREADLNYRSSYNRYEQNLSPEVAELRTKFNQERRKHIFLNKERISSRDLGNYTMTSAQLGWINCDRFTNYTGERKQVAVNYQPGERYYLVFNDIKSMIQPRREGDRLVFNNIPKDMKTTLVGLKIENEQAQLYYEHVPFEKEVSLQPQFKSATISEIQEVMQSLEG